MTDRARVLAIALAIVAAAAGCSPILTARSLPPPAPFVIGRTPSFSAPALPQVTSCWNS